MARYHHQTNLLRLSWVLLLLTTIANHASFTNSAQVTRNLRRTQVINANPEESIRGREVITESDDQYDYESENGSSEEVTEEPGDFPPVSVKRHPCQRPCDKNTTMTCRYDFTIEYFSTMSKACFSCPYNITHCSLPECIAGDGMKRTVLTINRQLPGPSIEVCYGDTIEVEVQNHMLDISTTIHWHGIRQKETPFMDGVPFVSQCLIPPQATFLYRFFADNPGTHLWHAHSALQRGDGIFGPLIVKPLQDPHAGLYDFDLPEHTITVIDWEHTLSVNRFVSHYHSTGDNKPPSILVNGKGRFAEFRDGSDILFTPAETFTVKSGYRYRFRLINAGFLNCPIEMSIDNHNFTVIASDGGNLQPVETDSLVSVAGERFDIILEANQEVGNYWMRFRGLLDCKVKHAFQVAILHYEGAPEDEDPEVDATYDTSTRKGFQVNSVNTPAGTENTLIMSELSSTPGEEDPVLKPKPDVKFYIPFDFYPVDNIHYQPPPHALPKGHRSYTPQMNHISMEFPNFPVMADLQRAASLDACNATSVSMECRFAFCECPHILSVPLNAVVEFILIDEGVPYEANHPFHLHGYNFRVIGMDRLGSSTTEEEVRRLDEQGMLKRNFNNPPIKDTVTIPDGGYAILRFHATNPGFWILHCHLDFHVELGMALLFKVGEAETFKLPPDDLPMCGNVFNPRPVNQTTKYTARFFPKYSNSNMAKGTSHINNHISSSNSLKFNHFTFFLLFSVLHLKIF